MNYIINYQQRHIIHVIMSRITGQIHVLCGYKSVRHVISGVSIGKTGRGVNRRAKK